MASKKNVTFADIARFTGFSKTTISRYFNKPDSLTEKNQEIIRDALEKLNYQENKVARVLANGQTEFIGIIVPDLYHHFYSEMLNQLLDTYEEFGYKFLVFVGNTKEEIERKYIQELMAYKIEGLIVLSHTISSVELAALNIPVVTIEREDQYVSSVNTDNYVGGQMAARLLEDAGCDVYINVHSSTPNHLIPAYQRITGFVDYCEEHHLKNEIMLKDITMEHDPTKKIMEEALEEMETKYPDCKKGIFLSSDTYANVLLNLIIRKYRSFSDDFAIVGFDNSAISKESILTISTIGQQTKQLAYSALEILDRQLKGKISREPLHISVPPKAFARETTEGYQQ